MKSMMDSAESVIEKFESLDFNDKKLNDVWTIFLKQNLLYLH